MDNSTQQQKVVAIGGDHAGFKMKEKVKRMLEAEGYTVIDHGTDSEESVDYPDFVHPVASDVECGTAAEGIILCGSGNGAAMSANKHQGIRAALCWNAELASLAKQHNNANVLSIPARFVDEDMTFSIVKAFLNAHFEGGRHARRVAKIAIQKDNDKADC